MSFNVLPAGMKSGVKGRLDLQVSRMLQAGFLNDVFFVLGEARLPNAWILVDRENQGAIHSTSFFS